MLLIHTEKVHSRYFSQTAFEKMTGKKPEIPMNLTKDMNMSIIEGNKELYIVDGAVHTDLYDNRAGVIPYDKMVDFFTHNLK